MGKMHVGDLSRKVELAKLPQREVMEAQSFSSRSALR